MPATQKTVYNLHMRILINAVSARAGGGVSYLQNLFSTLPALCPDVEFLAVVPDLDLNLTPVAHDNLRIKKIAEASGSAIKRYIWENTGLLRLCKDWAADMLFCVANVTPFIQPQIPVTVMIQNVAPLTPEVFQLLRKFEPISKYWQMKFLQFLTIRAIKTSSTVISLSRATSQLLKVYCPEISSPIIYHGTTAGFSPDAQRSSAVPESPYLLYVSNLYVYKGLEYLVEAAESFPQLPPIYVVGKTFDTGYTTDVKKSIERKGLEERIKFVDSVPHAQLPSWYAHAEAMVYPSWCENCPNILLEAMACGCPTIAMDVGPMPEICGDAATYAAPFNGKDLGQAISKMLQMNRRELKKKALLRSRIFTWENSMQRHCEFLLKQK